MSPGVATRLRTRQPVAPRGRRGIRPGGPAHDRAALVWFLGPAVAFYVLFLIIPLVGTIGLSFTEWPGFNFSQLHWVGLENFRELAGDSIFFAALAHNIVLVLGAIVLKTLVAVVLALALDQRLPLSSFFRGVYLMPTIISLVVVALVFSLALSPSLGLINPLLQAIGLGQFTGEWLGDPDRVLPMVILIDAWGGFGLFMFLIIARLMAIPQDLRDAAAVDGAGEIRTIRHVILPQLRSTISMVVLLAAIQSLKMFELIYVMTSGGPNHASEVLATWAYFQGFTASRVGYGSAILVVLLVITFALAFVYVKKFRMQDDD